MQLTQHAPGKPHQSSLLQGSNHLLSKGSISVSSSGAKPDWALLYGKLSLMAFWRRLVYCSLCSGILRCAWLCKYWSGILFLISGEGLLPLYCLWPLLTAKSGRLLWGSLNLSSLCCSGSSKVVTRQSSDSISSHSLWRGCVSSCKVYANTVSFWLSSGRLTTLDLSFLRLDMIAEVSKGSTTGLPLVLLCFAKRSCESQY